MSSKQGTWHSGEVLAFTEREGPGRPPAGSSRWSAGALAGVLGVTFAGLLSSDTLCPDHRAWVQTLAGVAFLAVITALVALWRGWAAGPLLTLVASLAGIAIGLLDAVHSPTRGRLVAVGFAAATMLAAVMVWRAWRLARWDPAATAPSVLDHDQAAKPVEVQAEIAPQSPVVPADEASNRV